MATCYQDTDCATETMAAQGLCNCANGSDGVKPSYTKQSLLPSHHGFNNREAPASNLAAIFLCNNSMQSYVVVIAELRCEASNRVALSVTVS